MVFEKRQLLSHFDMSNNTGSFTANLRVCSDVGDFINRNKCFTVKATHIINFVKHCITKQGPCTKHTQTMGVTINNESTLT